MSKFSEIPTEQPALPKLVLDPASLSLAPELIYQVAHEQVDIEMAERALAKVRQGHEVVLQAMRNHQSIYGLTVGVGWNKDKPVFSDKQSCFESQMIHSQQHNLYSLRAHAAGVGKPLSESTVRAAMLIRLNMMLIGASGVQPAVVELLCKFLQKGITPVVPGKGSVGKADITQNAHIGLALAGEWDVMYQNQCMSALEAMELTGLAPVELVGKDFLALVSSNNITAARFALALSDVSLLIKRLEVIFPLALEAMNGNLTPFLDAVTSARPYPGMRQVSQTMCRVLEGSDLWKPDPNRQLQDSLSLRDIAYTMGQLVILTQQAETALLTHLNHSDDNPLVVIGESETSTALDEIYQVRNEQGELLGAIFPSANYDGQPLAVTIEHLLAALARISNILAMQLVRTGSPAQTGLPKFLSHPENTGHAFGALQKPMLALDKENQILAQPVSLGHAVMAGGVEDVTSFGMLATEHLELILVNLYEMASLHLLHMTQAIDLREGFVMSTITKQLHAAYREQVSMVKSDRVFTKDIELGVSFLQVWFPDHD
ncbi:HAL/PAL/TAL family ammonia-lyase [Reinekea marinisedimentorum]|uniref:Histidine ammonia-lyase n=1 Tax=Reinekea marinisedimentorum TaxID=230495 RepID=A0A4R3HWQ5_9GAMM|nr:aromatic amino acid ammonia-lyase [Reinekea marinisedimentorum]TCS36691.1 histidine ammonia-lyase [Reinekea marinisedimentorum]